MTTGPHPVFPHLSHHLSHRRPTRHRTAERQHSEEYRP
ncbi:hypothetical protein SUDANB150_06309 [Streptomyces sp. enrichment culture]